MPGTDGPASILTGTCSVPEKPAGSQPGDKVGMDGGRGAGTGGGGGGTVIVLFWVVSPASEIIWRDSSDLKSSTLVFEFSTVVLEAEVMSPSDGVRVVTCFPCFFLSLGVPVLLLLVVGSLEGLERDDVEDGDDDLEACPFFKLEEIAETRRQSFLS